jgi:hypothetical protein
VARECGRGSERAKRLTKGVLGICKDLHGVSGLDAPSIQSSTHHQHLEVQLLMRHHKPMSFVHHLEMSVGRVRRGKQGVCVCCWSSSCSLPVRRFGRRLSAAEDLALNADQIALKIGALDWHVSSTQYTSQKFCDLITMCGDLLSGQAICFSAPAPFFRPAF